MSSERSIAAAKAVEIGLLAQDRLDTSHRSVLTQIESRDLRRLVEQGQAEYELLILSNLRLVFHWSRWVAKSVGVDWVQDAFQAGVFGLIRGIQGWDYNMGYTLSTYVSWHIRQQIQRWRVNESLNIRIPVHMWERLQSTQRDGTNQNDESALRALRVISLDEVPEGDPAFVWDGGIETSAEEADLSRAVESVLSVLTEREVHVLMLRHGLGSRYGEYLTLDAIGEILGVTRERIRQIEAKRSRRSPKATSLPSWSTRRESRMR
jgi:RNA polymerase primary sigma factor